MKFASPVSGTVSAVVRGDRRKVMSIRVTADAEQQYRDFGKLDLASADAQKVKDLLLEAGLFGYINQLPFAVSTTPDTNPKAIYVSAFRDMPLAADFEYELEGQEADFQAGISALAKIANVNVGIGKNSSNKLWDGLKDAQVNRFVGPCPAANVGVQINHIDPVNKGEVVWTVDPVAVLFIGRLVNNGRVDLTRLVAVAGAEIKTPEYAEALVGTPLCMILKGKLKRENGIRIINGNPLTGRKATADDFLGAHTSEVCVIPEGNDADEMFGWIMPRFNQFSANHSYFSWLFGKRNYNIDARIKGGKRHMIMSGEYDKVLPMDIYGEYLIKAIIAGDIDRQEQLGIYEVSPEDFAVAEFVCSSKLELQDIVRKGLDILRKERFTMVNFHKRSVKIILLSMVAALSLTTVGAAAYAAGSSSASAETEMLLPRQVSRKRKSTANLPKRFEAHIEASILLCHLVVEIGAPEFADLFLVADIDRQRFAVGEPEQIAVHILNVLHVYENAADTGKKAFVSLQRCRQLSEGNSKRDAFRFRVDHRRVSLYINIKDLFGGNAAGDVFLYNFQTSI